MEMLKNNNIKMKDGARYMDDIRAFLASLKKGWRWLEGGLYYCAAWRLDDEKLEKSPTRRTADVLRDSMNDVFSFLNLTIEIAEDFEDKKLPTLDLKVWMSLDNKILFEFYEKPMNTNMVLQRKSALSENIKMSSLTQEVIRRMLNCCELAENSCRVESLNNLAVKMCTSGYDTRYIRKVFVAGIKGYEKKLENSRKPHTDPKYKPLHLAKT